MAKLKKTAHKSSARKSTANAGSGKTKTLIDAVNAAIVKVEADGQMAKFQKEWFGQTMNLPKTVPEPKI